MTDIEFHEQGLASARREGNRQMIASHLGSLGNLYAAQGSIQRGIQCLEECKQIRESMHDSDGVALACYNLASCYEIGLRDMATAVRYLEYAASVASPDNPQKQVYASMAAYRREELRRGQQRW